MNIFLKFEELKNLSIAQVRKSDSTTHTDDILSVEDYEDEFAFINEKIDLNAKYNLHLIIPIVWSLIIIFGFLGKIIFFQ